MMQGVGDTPNDSVETQQVLSSLEHESADLWNRHRLLALGSLTLPVWLSLIILVAFWLVRGAESASRLFVAAIAALAAGRFIIWGGDAGDNSIGFSATQLALLVLYLDTVWATVLTWHTGFLFHVPWIGNRLHSAVRKGTGLLQNNRWMRNVTVFAVLLFVMLPVSSTGSIGGSLLGRLMGLPRFTTFLVVLLGSVVGGSTMLLGAELLKPWFGEVNPLLRYGGIVAIVVLGIVLGRRYRSSVADS